MVSESDIRDKESKNRDVDDATQARAFSDRLRDQASAQYISRSNLQRWTGTKKQTFAGYWNGERLPPADLLFRLAERLQVSPRWLLYGEEGPSSRTFDRHTDVDRVSVAEIEFQDLGSDCQELLERARTLQFSRDWLASITQTEPGLLVFARARGDAMTPTIVDGDIILIDRSVKVVREQDAIWALRVDGGMAIRRLRPKGEIMHVLADNGRVPADQAQVGQVKIVGRVIFIGRRF